ncbi:putative MFS-type transporter EfpA [Paraconexibacter sp. AEG42_29]|uniref:MFS-type transporter EfpA n=1 Tax=Paraconexibacter sp. AEG42_29 TaxID=2997339 RepID=A0AAU7AQC7_9ACTN
MPSTHITDDRFDKRAWALLLVVCGAVFLDGLDVSMVGVALPSIDSDLHLSTTSLQWIVSGYVLGYGGFLLLGGRAADLLGRRRVFLAALVVFALASLLGGLVSDGTLLIATRFLKGIAAAFTAPAALSIVTTTFSEGPARNRALAIYAATGATGFSSGLIFGGVLTELGWRFTFLVPVVLTAGLLVLALKYIPDTGVPERDGRTFDIPGASLITGSMLLAVFTIVEAPNAGWTSMRTLGGAFVALALVSLFIQIEQRSKHPLVRLGILRSAKLRRANLTAMTVFGAWIGFQFVGTLYMQQLRGWSAFEMAGAFLPAGLIVAFGSPRSGTLVNRFGTARVVTAGMASFVGAYALSTGITADSSYATGILPTMVLGGLGFMFTFGPLNMAATEGITDDEQGLASGLLFTSLQFGGAVALAIATAAMDAATDASQSPAGSAAAQLDGYHAALLVSVAVAVIGLGVAASGLVGPARAWAGRFRSAWQTSYNAAGDHR